MTRVWMNTLRGALCACALGTGLAAGDARAQVEIVVGPPADILATTAPVYFEGRPAYWWGGRWYYRDGPGWRFYGAEPGYLHEWRGRHEVYRHHYGWGYRRR